MAKFKDLLSLPALHTFVKDAGFKHPTKVQAAAIPHLLSGESLSVLAQTGSGKTLAYALPLVQLLKKLENESPEEETQDRTPIAWIITPTHELGAQVEAVFKSIAHQAKLRIRLVRKGSTQKKTRSSMSGAIDVLIGSPSRVLGALKTGLLKADAARFLIIDEADQLFDPGFLPDVQALISRLQSPQLQVGLFSATRPSAFNQLRSESFPGIKFKELEFQGSHTLKNNIATTNLSVPFSDKLEKSVQLLNQVKGPGMLFVNLKRTAEKVFSELSEALPDKRIHLLHGGMEREDRRTALARFADDGDFLVCTDIAARGIDIPTLNWVLNYDLPFEPVYYIHRCGRVGRRGQPAQVYNLVTTKDFPLIARINTAIANQSSLKLSKVVEKKEASKKRSAASKAKKAPARRKPSAAKPSAGKKTHSKSSSGKPATSRPGRGKPATSKPGRGKPAAKKRTNRKPTRVSSKRR
jgi:superfamily II DNA/RNA helicase